MFYLFNLCFVYDLELYDFLCIFCLHVSRVFNIYWYLSIILPVSNTNSNDTSNCSIVTNE
jgi:hypothetical protein